MPGERSRVVWIEGKCLLIYIRTRETSTVYSVLRITINLVLPILPETCGGGIQNRKRAFGRKIGGGSRGGLSTRSRRISGRCKRKPGKHSSTDQYQNEDNDADDDADTVARTLGRWWCLIGIGRIRVLQGHFIRV